MKYNHIYKQIRWFLAVALTFFSIQVNAQSAITVAGGTAKSSNGSVSYAVGQVFQLKSTNIKYFVKEGVLQVHVPSGDSFVPTEMKLSMYPNPVVDYLNIDINSDHTTRQDLQFVLFDVSGRKRNEGILRIGQNKLNMSAFESGIFLLRIQSGANQTHDFKVIKR